MIGEETHSEDGMLTKIIGIVFVFFTLSAGAHPVIYKDGLVLSSSNMRSFSDNQVMYSWSSRWSSGLNHWRFTREEKNTEFVFAKLNHLLYRYNGEDSQANIYLHGGAGAADSEIERRQTNEAFMAGVEADWETRKLYSAMKYYHFTSPKVTDLSMLQARLGFSPYEAPFDELQTWFMLQAMLMPEIEAEVLLTPMLRFFYKNVLWEIGSSTRGEWMLNLMVHY
jgi:hypothetical protein